jgi:prepilin-type N-terminal cleavage/methylation domain-containing protein
MMRVVNRGMAMRSNKLNGFTLIEILVVIAIIGILAGMVLSVTSGVKQRALIKQAKVEAEGLAIAIRSYHSTFSSWPATTAGDRSWTNSNEGVVTNLINQQGQTFYEGLVSNRYAIDPFRSNLHYRVTISPSNNYVKVWSCGPNCRDEGGLGDDVEAHH